MKTTHCPACSCSNLEPFYNAGDVPVHTTLLMPTRQQALEYPKRPLELAWCRACGFIFNWRFEPGLHEYSGACEESQACSPKFSRWLEDLAAGMVEDHDIRGKRVVEIGCGKGEFLAALCRQGDNEGIGYDPAYVPGRLDSGESARLDIKTRLWDADCGLHDADVVVCRHTLEHIADVHDFLSGIRHAMAGRPDTLLFVEVPDTTRVLQEAAFWDIYYEHCSYFTTESLVRLFHSTGFDVLESQLDYDDQYILLLARPLAPESAEQGSSKPSHGVTAIGVFGQAYDAVHGRWASLLEVCAGKNREVVLWGGGSKAAAFLNRLDLQGTVSRVIDINPEKHHAYIPGTGQEVVGPEDLQRRPADVVIAMNPVYTGEISQVLDAMDCDAELLAL